VDGDFESDMVLGLEWSLNADANALSRRAGRDKNSGVKRSRRQPPEEPPWQAAAVVEHDACSGDRAVVKHSSYIVIASEAKQSSLLREVRLDCFVASAPRNDGGRSKKRGASPRFS
jgi:hypothetical protein